MPVIKLNDQPFLLRPGTNRLGGGDFVEISVSPDVSLGIQAIIEVTGTEGVVIRRAPDKPAVVLVNGVLLGDPTPLIHGDKIEIAGRELSFSDDTKSGATTFVSRSEIAAATAEPERAKPAAPTGPTASTASASTASTASAASAASTATAAPTGASGGRLISLVDGREYIVPETGLTIGREAGSDVVLTHKQVSRKHATIKPTPRGYELEDTSSNGVYVNGHRVAASQILGRSDVIRIAKDEFRFYADVSVAAPQRLSFQAYAPKPRPPSATPSGSSRRTPAGSKAVLNRLAYQEKKRGTPHTPAPAAARAVPDERGGGFGWMWGVVLLVLGVAAYYMLK